MQPAFPDEGAVDVNAGFRANIGDSPHTVGYSEHSVVSRNGQVCEADVSGSVASDEDLVAAERKRAVSVSDLHIS